MQLDCSEVIRTINYAHKCDPTIPAVVTQGESSTPYSGGTGDEISDWESVVYSCPADFYRSLPQEVLTEEMWGEIEADDVMKAEEKRSRVLSWLAAID